MIGQLLGHYRIVAKIGEGGMGLSIALTMRCCTATWPSGRLAAHLGPVYSANPTRCSRCLKRSSARRSSYNGSLFISNENTLRSSHAFSSQQNACSRSPIRAHARAY